MTPEIRVERQAGGWIWVALSAGVTGEPTFVVAQSREAFATDQEAIADDQRYVRSICTALSETPKRPA